MKQVMVTRVTTKEYYIADSEIDMVDNILEAYQDYDVLDMDNNPKSNIVTYEILEMPDGDDISMINESNILDASIIPKSN